MARISFAINGVKTRFRPAVLSRSHNRKIWCCLALSLIVFTCHFLDTPNHCRFGFFFAVEAFKGPLFAGYRVVNLKAKLGAARVVVGGRAQLHRLAWTGTLSQCSALRISLIMPHAPLTARMNPARKSSSEALR